MNRLLLLKPWYMDSQVSLSESLQGWLLPFHRYWNKQVGVALDDELPTNMCMLRSLVFIKAPFAWFVAWNEKIQFRPISFMYILLFATWSLVTTSWSDIETGYLVNWSMYHSIFAVNFAIGSFFWNSRTQHRLLSTERGAWCFAITSPFYWGTLSLIAAFYERFSGRKVDQTKTGEVHLPAMALLLVVLFFDMVILTGAIIFALGVAAMAVIVAVTVTVSGAMLTEKIGDYFDEQYKLFKGRRTQEVSAIPLILFGILPHVCPRIIKAEKRKEPR